MLGCASAQFETVYPTYTLQSQERYFLGLLLTGRCEEILKRTPVDVAQMTIDKEEVAFRPSFLEIVLSHLILHCLKFPTGFAGSLGTW